MFQYLSGIFSNRPRRTVRPSHGGSLFRQPFSFKPRVDARYDAAVTNDDNRRHWSAADGLSAKSANGASIRRTLRNRARYEIANNSYARGISLTLANDIVGTGPRLQMLTDDPADNRIIEIEFSRWSNAVGLAEKLRTMKLACCGDGEAFGIMTSNPSVQTPVQLDLMLVEADQVTTPFGVHGLSNYIDGIQFDSFGNPVFYHVLKSHPGDTGTAWGEFGTVATSAMLHLFRVDRPGQVRGIPEITPALPLFAQLRRFTLAVIAAAETAADFAGILYTDSPANGEADAAEPFEPIELEKRSLVTMPGGWKMSQIHAEQPTTSYAEFKHEILNEIARCLNMPFNVAADNSSGYNYASGRLDHQTYFKSIRVDQTNMARVVLDRILIAWLNEAILIEGLLPQSVRTTTFVPTHQWFFDGHEHVDPLKEANAQATRLSNHTTTLSYEYARQGRDWEDALNQRAKELALMSELGLALPGAPPPVLTPDVNEESLSDPAANDE